MMLVLPAGSSRLGNIQSSAHDGGGEQDAGQAALGMGIEREIAAAMQDNAKDGGVEGRGEAGCERRTDRLQRMHEHQVHRQVEGNRGKADFQRR